VRLVSQLHFNQLFFKQINKGGLNHLVISYLCGFATIPLPYYHSFWEFFISSTLIPHMANTRNRVAVNNADNNEENNNNDANPPPPPPPTLEQVLATQAQMLQTMQ
jgi:hypothetical protein